MNAAKLTPALTARLAAAASTEVLDVVVELRPPAEPLAAVPTQSRGEAIAARKAAFQRSVEPVEEAIQALGGQVLERAWINQAVRARVPARGVEHLSDLDRVAVVDVPRRLEPEPG